MAEPRGIPGTAILGNPDVQRFMGDPGLKQNTPPAAAQKPAFTGATPPAPPAPTPVVAKPEALTPLEEVSDAPPVDPHEAYLKELERLKISRDDAAKLVDSMLFKGYYEEDVQLSRKVSVRFRTRDQAAIDRVNREIDKADPKFNGVLYGIIAEYNLAASLVKFGPHAFDPTTDEGIETTRKYIKGLAGPVYQLLATKLSKFDEKCMAVMTDGAVEHFF